MWPAYSDHAYQEDDLLNIMVSMGWLLGQKDRCSNPDKEEPFYK